MRERACYLAHCCGLRAPDLQSEIGLSRSSETVCKQLGRLLHCLRGLGLETVHQKAVGLIVVVEHSPQVLPGRRAPFPLQLGRNRSPADGCDPMIIHPGDR